ncbi:hypothetical protein TGVEG_265260 [Toxoplasma gondii VEG]|uniref:Uncharacterized protein n=1 Tax=Toxoplasma gondii (strain ATCC 50861 / VEG) TaxID=432359 RepID=B9QER8_TOXGV|nr:hypothetical protein TGVEG_265260 [Toxoplasma gondii VEG]CEL75751.1 TPA: hypothetical protein BN1205_081080 [Toxoplasma gondii VEG]
MSPSRNSAGGTGKPPVFPDSSETNAADPPFPHSAPESDELAKLSQPTLQRGGAETSSRPPGGSPAITESEQAAVAAKIHATRAMWQVRLDEKMAKQEQRGYDEEALAARRQDVLNQRETKRFIRHESRSVDSDSPTWQLARTESNLERPRGSSTPEPSSPASGGRSPSAPDRTLTEEEKMKKQEEEDLLVAQRLQEEEALAASAAEAALFGEGEATHAAGEGPVAINGAETGDTGEVDRDFLLAMELQEQSQREAQQESDSLLAALLQQEEAAAAAPPRVIPSCLGDPLAPFVAQRAVPAYHTAGEGQVNQSAGVQRIQTVNPVSSGRPQTGDAGKTEKRRGFFSRIFGKKDKSNSQNTLSSSSSRPHFLSNERQVPAGRPDLIAAFQPAGEAAVTPVSAAYQTVGSPQIVSQSLELPERRTEIGQGANGEERQQRQVAQVVQTVEPARRNCGPQPPPR